MVGYKHTNKIKKRTKEKVVESTESVKEPAFRPFAIFNAGSLTLSVDSTTFSFIILFVCLYSPFYFLFCFFRNFVSHCYSFPLSNYRLFITC